MKVLLSHRYGTRCLPSRILATEYEIFRNELKNNQHFSEDELSFIDETREMNLKNLFENCYNLDENEIPSRYKLIELDSLIPKYNEKVF